MEKSENLMMVGREYQVYRIWHSWGANCKTDYRLDWGRCIWIHPKKRFVLMEFSDGIRQCIQLIDGQPAIPDM